MSGVSTMLPDTDLLDNETGIVPVIAVVENHEEPTLEQYVFDCLAEGEIRFFYIPADTGRDPRTMGSLRKCKIPPPRVPAERSGDDLLRDTEHVSEYEALSYAWGPTYPDGSHLTDYIICNGRRLDVTAKLHVALKEMRTATKGSREYQREWQKQLG